MTLFPNLALSFSLLSFINIAQSLPLYLCHVSPYSSFFSLHFLDDPFFFFISLHADSLTAVTPMLYSSLDQIQTVPDTVPRWIFPSFNEGCSSAVRRPVKMRDLLA